MNSPDADRQYMQLALDACRTGVEKGQSPFGACIVRAGQVLAATHNHVWLQTDPTAHAEVQAIRSACQKLGDVHLTGATIYSTTEPCPMCFAAIHWARIDRIVYAATVTDAQDNGFNELQIFNQQLKDLSGSNVTLVPGLMREQALDLYRQWRTRKDHRPY